MTTQRDQLRRRCTGFTLLEVLLVSCVLGMLALAALPRDARATQSMRENTLRDELRFIRMQIEMYRAQHQGRFPGINVSHGQPEPAERTIIDQLTRHTDALGSPSFTRTATHLFGPYLLQVRVNPINRLGGVKVIAAHASFKPDGSTGWIYQPSSGIWRANLTGQDSEGYAYIDY